MVAMLSRICAFDACAKAVMQAKPFPESGEPDDVRWLPAVECAARVVSPVSNSPHSTCLSALVTDRAVEAWYHPFHCME
jgi:hypothetical protein